MATSDFIATISANGQIYSAWELVRVELNIGEFSVFEFTPTEGSYGHGYENFGLIPGDAVNISLGGVQVIKGNVTTRSVGYDKGSHQVVISGKSEALDHLAKSSVVVRPGTYNGYTFEQAARAVIAPHGVSLTMSNPPSVASKPFANLAVQYGETVAEFIQRIAMMRGIFLWDDANGNLVAGGADPSAAPVADLVEGQNILRAHMVWDNQLAFGTWRTTGQQPGNDNNWPPRAISATGTDTSERSNWFHLQLAEHPGDATDMAARTNYKMALAGQNVLQVSVTVVGWKKPSGSLWNVNEAVTLLSPMLFPTQTDPVKMGVQSLVFEQDANGTTTTLNLVLFEFMGSPVFPAGSSGIPNGPSVPTPATPDEPDWKGGPPT